MKRWAFAITLALVMAGSVLAQSKPAPAGQSLWGGYDLSTGPIKGIEAVPGTLDFEDSICWGRTFSMMSDTASFTVAPDYYFNLASDPADYINKVTSGSWTLMYRGKYEGMLFGTVTGGTIEWYFDKAGNISGGEIQLLVNIKGGTGSFAKVGGPHTMGTFTGTVDYANSGFPTVIGSLDLIF